MTEMTIFPSLAPLKVAHAGLLQGYRDAKQGNTPEFLDRIQAFIRQGQATGAVLDVEDERWTAQSLLDYWANVLYRAGRVSPETDLAVFDPMLAPEIADDQCPYVGLDAFRENDQDVFFGRERLVRELLSKLESSRLLVVMGSSGSGKSSLVRAGLIPLLKNGGLPESDHWSYLPPLVPGSHPLANLARLCLPAEADAAHVEHDVEQYLADRHRLVQVMSECFGGTVVLVVDQFEEVFTLCTNEEARNAFVDNLIALAQTVQPPHRVILTMRTDFEANIARLPQLQLLFEPSLVRVTPLNASELRQAIQAPAAQVGLKFEEGVVDALLHDTLGEPAALPLLQFSLLKLWENRQRNRITWEAYRRLGGGRQALARSADEFYERLIPEEQMTARRILLKMVRPGEGLEVTSNRVPRAALYQKAEANDRIDRVLDRLIQARLVRLSEGDTAADEQVEVAHEALIRNWPRLVEWLEEERVTLRQRQRLTAAAEQWQRLDRDAAALWRGALLEEARRYDDLSQLEAEFVRVSQNAERAEQERQEAARRTEQNLTVARRRLRASVSVITAMLALGLTAVVIVLIFRPVIYLFSPDASEINGYDATTLRWEASPFSNLRIEPDIGPITGTSGSIQVMPPYTTTYRIYADNLLTRVIPPLEQARGVQVRVRPTYPSIIEFSAARSRIRVGEPITVSWQVRNVDTLKLRANGTETTIPPDQVTGRRPLTLPVGSSDVSLVATNRYGPVVKEQWITVLQPSPKVVRFVVTPTTVISGEPVKVEWEVQNATRVNVDPFGVVELSGSRTFTPTYEPVSEVSVGYRYDAPDAGGGGGTPVIVLPPPVSLVSFEASAAQVARGGSVTFTWKLVGLERVAIVPLEGDFPAEGTVEVKPAATTTYTLVASDGKQVWQKSLRVMVK